MQGAGNGNPVINDLTQERKNIEPETKNMEVHHHPHVEKKNFKEYLLEGLMIFVAVTMGFIAESIREHVNDKGKEKEYLSSLVQELKYDTAQYNIVTGKILYLRPLLDSLYMNVSEAPKFSYTLLGRWNTPINETRLVYMPTLPTIQQLKSSGNLRLIENKEVLRMMMDYDSYIEGTMQSEAVNIKAATEKIYAKEDDLCDESRFNEETDHNMQDSAAQYNMENGSVYNMRLVVHDPVKLNEFANSFINYKSRNWGYYTNINTARQKATALIKLVRAEYGIDGN